MAYRCLRKNYAALCAHRAGAHRRRFEADSTRLARVLVPARWDPVPGSVLILREERRSR
jgi:hypothetical protein